MRGIRPLGAPGFDPTARFTGTQKRVEQTLRSLMSEQPLTKIVQQGEVKARVVQVETEGIFPIHAAPDGIGGLAVGEPFHILHHDDERQAPGGHFYGAALRGIEIGKELIVIERAELRAEVHIEVTFGEGSPHGSRGRVGNGWEGFRA
jgi:hypothetical protein